MGSTFPSPAALTTPNVTNASVQVAAVNLSRLGLFVFNCSSAVTIWVSPLGIPAVVGGSGSIAVQPLQGIMLGPPGQMPPWVQGLNAIASAAGTNALTVLEFYP
jgi:hypothetical protein